MSVKYLAGKVPCRCNGQLLLLLIIVFFLLLDIADGMTEQLWGGACFSLRSKAPGNVV